MIEMAIIGGGPAGLSAAVNGVARGRNVTVFSRNKETSMLYKAELVNNHLGMQKVSGKKLLDSFYDHASSLNIPVEEGRILQVVPMGNYFSINFDNDIYEAKSVVLAVGVSKIGVFKGENEFLGKGVSYCATCDGMLYKGKNVVVISEIEEALDDLEFLNQLCSNVTLISKKLATVNVDDGIKKINSSVTEIIGDDVVSGVKTNDGTVDCDGVFIIKEYVPATSLMYGLKTNENGAIEVNRFMETNLPGVFACGDCTGWPFQLSNAIGEGLIAAQQADKYLRTS